jgi:hypothetical protein
MSNRRSNQMARVALLNRRRASDRGSSRERRRPAPAPKTLTISADAASVGESTGTTGFTVTGSDKEGTATIAVAVPFASDSTGARMSEFVVETYACDEAAARLTDISRAAEASSDPEVHLLGAIFLPDEETCFYLFDAPSADAVRAAVTRARLPFERISAAISINPAATCCE